MNEDKEIFREIEASEVPVEDRMLSIPEYQSWKKKDYRNIFRFRYLRSDDGINFDRYNCNRNQIGVVENNPPGGI
jgi:hypothetical protein